MFLTIILALCALVLAAGLVMVSMNKRQTGEPDIKEAETQENKEGIVRKQGRMPAPNKSSDKELYIRCCKYMELRKPFLVDNFCLDDLAMALFTNKLYLSQTINACSGRNFRAYVNSYRVMYAMELFKKNKRLRVADLANLSGFHTPVTFNMAFKLVMDESPSTWCARIRAQKEN